MKWVQVLAPMVAGLSLTVNASALFKRQGVAAPTGIAPDATNTLSDVKYLDYGILLANNKDSGCAMVRLTKTAGVVAAHCFEWDANNSTNVLNYQIALMGANNGPLGAKSVTNVKRYPYYNPDNYANNLAIVYFANDQTDGSDYSGIIADYPSSWKNDYLVKYSLNNDNPMTPNTPQTIQYLATETADCTAASDLFASESENYICNFPNVASPQNPGCNTGYSLVAGVVENNIAWGAIYSFSTGDSTNVLCGSQLPMLSYYTILRNYVPWFQEVLGNTATRAMPVTDASYTAPQASNEPTNIRANVNSGSANYISRDGNTNKALSETEYNNRPNAYKNVNQVAKANSISVTESSQQVSTSVEISTSVVLVSSTVVVTDSTMLSAQTTQTFTTTDTSTTVQTSTETTTSTEVVTSTATVTTTAVVTGTVNAAANGSNGAGNSIGIVVNGGSDNTVTVTSTSTQTVSAIQTVTETSLMTVTASVIISESVIPGGGTSIIIGATTVPPAVAETVTVTDVSTSVVTSIFTVTAVPTGYYGVTMTATEGPVSTITVTETVASYIQGTVASGAVTSSSESSSEEEASSTGVYSLGASENVSTTAKPEEKKKLSAGVIAAIAILALLAAAILFYLWRKRKNQGDGYMNDENGLSRVRRWLFNRENNYYANDNRSMRQVSAVYDNPPDYSTNIGSR
ncbi:hypothetical protein IW150_002540 [Coemansia sp. RSA 2607]|nr:hypothetical protein IW150_002540 [Coemansia sp. RSA 2607]KAJ2396124.1 hypothetical protein GGI05_001276 [Coemansia sp. RSA 2603]